MWYFKEIFPDADERVVQVFGTSGSGKTSLALTLAREVLEESPSTRVAYVDWTGCVTSDWLAGYRIDEQRVTIIHPSTLEEGLSSCAECDFVVLDGVEFACGGVAFDAYLDTWRTFFAQSWIHDQRIVLLNGTRSNPVTYVQRVAINDYTWFWDQYVDARVNLRRDGNTMHYTRRTDIQLVIGSVPFPRPASCAVAIRPGSPSAG